MGHWPGALGVMAMWVAAWWQGEGVARWVLDWALQEESVERNIERRGQFAQKGDTHGGVDIDRLDI